MIWLVLLAALSYLRVAFCSNSSVSSIFKIPDLQPEDFENWKNKGLVKIAGIPIDGVAVAYHLQQQNLDAAIDKMSDIKAQTQAQAPDPELQKVGQVLEKAFLRIATVQEVPIEANENLYNTLELGDVVERFIGQRKIEDLGLEEVEAQIKRPETDPAKMVRLLWRKGILIANQNPEKSLNVILESLALMRYDSDDYPSIPGIGEIPEKILMRLTTLNVSPEKAAEAASTIIKLEASKVPGLDKLRAAREKASSNISAEIFKAISTDLGGEGPAGASRRVDPYASYETLKASKDSTLLAIAQLIKASNREDIMSNLTTDKKADAFKYLLEKVPTIISENEIANQGEKVVITDDSDTWDFPEYIKRLRGLWKEIPKEQLGNAWSKLEKALIVSGYRLLKDRLEADHQPSGKGLKTDHQPSDNGLGTDQQSSGNGLGTNHQPSGSGLGTDNVNRNLLKVAKEGLLNAVEESFQQKEKINILISNFIESTKVWDREDPLEGGDLENFKRYIDQILREPGLEPDEITRLQDSVFGIIGSPKQPVMIMKAVLINYLGTEKEKFQNFQDIMQVTDISSDFRKGILVDIVPEKAAAMLQPWTEIEFEKFWRFLHEEGTDGKDDWEQARRLYYDMVVYHVQNQSFETLDQVAKQSGRIFLGEDKKEFFKHCKEISEKPTLKGEKCILFFYKELAKMKKDDRLWMIEKISATDTTQDWLILDSASSDERKDLFDRMGPARLLRIAEDIIADIGAENNPSRGSVYIDLQAYLTEALRPLDKHLDVANSIITYAGKKSLTTQIKKSIQALKEENSSLEDAAQTKMALLEDASSGERMNYFKEMGCEMLFMITQKVAAGIKMNKLPGAGTVYVDLRAYIGEKVKLLEQYFAAYLLITPAKIRKISSKDNLLKAYIEKAESMMKGHFKNTTTIGSYAKVIAEYLKDYPPATLKEFPVLGAYAFEVSTHSSLGQREKMGIFLKNTRLFPPPGVPGFLANIKDKKAIEFFVNTLLTDAENREARIKMMTNIGDQVVLVKIINGLLRHDPTEKPNQENLDLHHQVILNASSSLASCKGEPSKESGVLAAFHILPNSFKNESAAAVLFNSALDFSNKPCAKVGGPLREEYLKLMKAFTGSPERQPAIGLVWAALASSPDDTIQNLLYATRMAIKYGAAEFLNPENIVIILSNGYPLALDRPLIQDLEKIPEFKHITRLKKSRSFPAIPLSKLTPNSHYQNYKLENPESLNISKKVKAFTKVSGEETVSRQIPTIYPKVRLTLSGGKKQDKMCKNLVLADVALISNEDAKKIDIFCLDEMKIEVLQGLFNVEEKMKAIQSPLKKGIITKLGASLVANLDEHHFARMFDSWAFEDPNHPYLALFEGDGSIINEIIKKGKANLLRAETFLISSEHWIKAFEEEGEIGDDITKGILAHVHYADFARGTDDFHSLKIKESLWTSIGAVSFKNFSFLGNPQSLENYPKLKEKLIQYTISKTPHVKRETLRRSTTEVENAERERKAREEAERARKAKEEAERARRAEEYGCSTDDCDGEDYEYDENGVETFSRGQKSPRKMPYDEKEPFESIPALPFTFTFTSDDIKMFDLEPSAGSGSFGSGTSGSGTSGSGTSGSGTSGSRTTGSRTTTGSGTTKPETAGSGTTRPGSSESRPSLLPTVTTSAETAKDEEIQGTAGQSASRDFMSQIFPALCSFTKISSTALIKRLFPPIFYAVGPGISAGSEETITTKVQNIFERRSSQDRKEQDKDALFKSPTLVWGVAITSFLVSAVIIVVPLYHVFFTARH